VCSRVEFRSHASRKKKRGSKSLTSNNTGTRRNIHYSHHAARDHPSLAKLSTGSQPRWDNRSTCTGGCKKWVKKSQSQRANVPYPDEGPPASVPCPHKESSMWDGGGEKFHKLKVQPILPTRTTDESKPARRATSRSP